VYRFPRVFWLLCGGLSFAAALPAQEQNSGKALFRSNCAFCHGVTAAGGRGPSLLTARIAQSSDDAIRNIIRRGIAGTTMPAFDNIEGDDLDKLLAYIRSLAGSGATTGSIAGNAKHGEKIYSQSGCAGCHGIGDSGSSFGPALTRIGGARSAEYIRQSIVDPSADIPPEYEGVTIVTKEGKRITGVRVNEDTFSIQLRLPNEKFAMFSKSDLAEVIYEKKSLMPAYGNLAAGDLQDLLAYLDTLRGDVAATTDATKAKGVH
jgi:putative heme-binding domain-containing protein